MTHDDLLEDMMKKLMMIAVFLASASIAFAFIGTQEKPTAPMGDLEKSVLDALWALPQYGVFDNLSFNVEGKVVTLLGQVLLPITKSEAARRVKLVKGVEKVVNNIEVLPLSPNDDSIRLSAFRALFGTSDLYRYSRGADPSIHIIVKGGHITLEGVVSTKQDAALALLAVRGVSGSFLAKSNLKIEK
jgi:hyperosmotically inducible periplasmic protein